MILNIFHEKLHTSRITYIYLLFPASIDYAFNIMFPWNRGITLACIKESNAERRKESFCCLMLCLLENNPIHNHVLGIPKHYIGILHYIIFTTSLHLIPYKCNKVYLFYRQTSSSLLHVPMENMTMRWYYPTNEPNKKENLINQLVERTKVHFISLQVLQKNMFTLNFYKMCIFWLFFFTF